MTMLNIRLRGLVLGAGLLIALLAWAGQAATAHAALLPEATADAGDEIVPKLGSARCGSTRLTGEGGRGESPSLACEPAEGDGGPAEPPETEAGPPPEPGVAKVPPRGGLTTTVAGTPDLEALIRAQRFVVKAVWRFNTESQTFEVYVPGAPDFANSLRGLRPSDIVIFKASAHGAASSVVQGRRDAGAAAPPTVVSAAAFTELPATGPLAGTIAGPPSADGVTVEAAALAREGSAPTARPSKDAARPPPLSPDAEQSPRPTRSRAVFVFGGTFVGDVGEFGAPEFAQSELPPSAPRWRPLRTQVQRAARERCSDAAQGPSDELAGGEDRSNEQRGKRPRSPDVQSRGALASMARSGVDG